MATLRSRGRVALHFHPTTRPRTCTVDHMTDPALDRRRETHRMIAETTAGLLNLLGYPELRLRSMMETEPDTDEPTMVAKVNGGSGGYCSALITTYPEADTDLSNRELWEVGVHEAVHLMIETSGLPDTVRDLREATNTEQNEAIYGIYVKCVERLTDRLTTVLTTVLLSPPDWVDGQQTDGDNADADD